MTEEEAKTKICCGPKVLAAAIFIAGKAKTTEPLGPVLCAGSACMAWRRDAATMTRKPDDTGFCGLAGKP